MELLSDNPITQKSDDKFVFESFVEILGDAILNTKSLPFTVGIFGGWGTGKTSLMHLLRGWLESNKCKTIWFNPWKYDNKEELWSALIRSIILEIYKVIPKTNRKLKKVAWRLLKDIAWFAFKGGISTATGGIISLGDLEKMKETMAKESLQEHDFLNEFESNFSKLVEDFVGEDGRLVVFIDDLDRCIPENAITILESLKLYLDNPHCVFVLGMDRAIVEFGIKHRYGEDIQLSGREYLEKIVQLPFFLPPIDFKKLKQALQSKITAVNYTPQIWALLQYGLGGNPRKVKRFVNSFYMVQEALKRQELGELSGFPSTDDNAEKIEDVPDEIPLFNLAEVLVIQMSYTDFYDYLLINPSGWDLYENLRLASEEVIKNNILKSDPDLAIVWQNRHLRLFMEEMSSGFFPPIPPPRILKKILRFTAIVERREHAESEKYEKKL
jgi:hypothetical protein